MYVVPDLINLFLSGFIFMSTYNWLNNREINISTLTIWSLFISYIVKSVFTTFHTFILPQITFPLSLRILIYSFSGLILAFICALIKRTKAIQRLLYMTANKSINTDIFDDVIDYDKPTMMAVYIKSSNIYYVGKFCAREENGLNSWLILIDYCSAYKDTDAIKYDPEIDNRKTTVAINLKDIERMELIYEPDSEVWKRLKGIGNLRGCI